MPHSGWCVSEQCRSEPSGPPPDILCAGHCASRTAGQRGRVFRARKVNERCTDLLVPCECPGRVDEEREGAQAQRRPVSGFSSPPITAASTIHTSRTSPRPQMDTLARSLALDPKRSHGDAAFPTFAGDPPSVCIDTRRGRSAGFGARTGDGKTLGRSASSKYLPHALGIFLSTCATSTGNPYGRLQPQIQGCVR